MILFKIKETAYINSGHVLFLSLGSHMMMALTQENVHYTLNSGPDVMNKSNRVHARIQEFLVGGGSRSDGQKTVLTMFFSHQLILQFTEGIQWFYYRGEEGGPTSSRGWGVQRNPYNL